MKKEKEDSDRRRFLKFGVLAGGATLAGLVVQKNLMGDTPSEIR
ncbi:MAG: twin-arginine translocation signal domain-containing protein [Bacteroidetes bacterium]|nr:twin-arginine translocation signal domain-containing protein [Bacteroidota bacterium]